MNYTSLLELFATIHALYIHVRHNDINSNYKDITYMQTNTAVSYIQKIIILHCSNMVTSVSMQPIFFFCINYSDIFSFPHIK